MATRTFLQMVNDVLRELREEEVATWDATEYSTLVGTYVNSAKRAVEAAWRWHALRETFTVPTVAGTVTYALTGTDDRAQVIDAWNYTWRTPLRETSIAYMNEIYFGGTPQEGSVGYWLHNGMDGTGQTQVDVYPIPDSVESLKFNVYNPPADFTAGADICYIPSRPIVDTALAIARGERGEDGGILPSEQLAFAKQAAGDAIALDAMKHETELRWEAE